MKAIAKYIPPRKLKERQMIGETAAMEVAKSTIFPKLFAMTQENINEGDEVFVEYTDGRNPTGDYEKGTLTKKWEDDPYCQIDNKGIDLASEGHSSNSFKILAPLSIDVSWEIKDGQEIEVAQEYIEEGISYFYENMDCKLHGVEKELAVKGSCGHYH